MRRIYCEKCGRIRPTPAEDVARGLIPRRTRGAALRELVCDQCGTVLSKGAQVVAESVPADMGEWERNYLNVEP